jgi:glycerate dehydrogenase
MDLKVKKVNIVVTDGYTLNPGDNPWHAVATLGNLTIYERSMEDEIVARCREAEILVVNKTQIRETALAEISRLKFIAVSATGFDCVDIEAAGKRGIAVSNVPVYGTDSVAQYVFSAILHLWHNIGVHDAAVKAGDWARQPDWSFWQTPLGKHRWWSCVRKPSVSSGSGVSDAGSVNLPMHSACACWPMIPILTIRRII